MKYAVVDENGFVKAFYSKEIHKNIPKEAIKISDDNWKKHISGKKQVYINGEWQDYIEPEEIVFERAKKSKLVEIKRSFLKSLEQGFTCSNGIKMNADISDISKLKAGIDLATILGHTSLAVRDYNNIVHNITVEEANKMVVELGVNYQTQLQKKWKLEDAVNATATTDELETIKW